MIEEQFWKTNMSLIREVMTKGIITVDKFLIAEDVQDELYQISEDSKA